MGFAIVTLVVCMLAAWEWGQLSGFTSTSQRVWLAVLCGLLLAAMLFLLPEYHYDVHQPMVEGSLWASFAWWIVALLLVLVLLPPVAGLLGAACVVGGQHGECLEPGGWMLCTSNCRKLGHEDFRRMVARAVPGFRLTRDPMPPDFSGEDYLKRLWIDWK